MARTEYLVELAAGNAATDNKILNWQPQTRVKNRAEALDIVESYRRRGFWVRLKIERGGVSGRVDKGVTVFAPFDRVTPPTPAPTIPDGVTANYPHVEGVLKALADALADDATEAHVTRAADGFVLSLTWRDA